MEVFEGGRTRCSGLKWMKYFLLGAMVTFMPAASQESLASSKSAGNFTFDVGKNQIGEACRVVASPGGQDTSGVHASLDVFCGNWEKPSAKIFIVKADKPVMDLATQGWWHNRLESFASCGPPSSTGILDGIHAVSIDCKLRPGGWPYQALAVSVENNSYLADSIPAAYPVVERTIGVLSGKLARSRATEQGTASAEINRLESTLANAKYSAGDLSSYRDLLWTGQYYNFLGNHAEAEKRYVMAMELEQKLLPGGMGDQCFLCMHIGLELSNQERFNLAEAMFDRAKSLLQKSAEPATEEARLAGYLAIHMANSHKKKEALDLARRATALRRELAAQYGYSGEPRSQSAQPSAFREQTKVSEAGVGSASSQRTMSVFGDLIQSLCLEAAMLIDLKQLDQADHVLDEAARVLDEESRLPKRWRCQVMLLQARIAELRDNWPRAEALLLSAIDIQRSLYAESRNEGLALSELGRVYAAQGRSGQALDAFRKGFDVINKAQSPIGIEEASAFFRVCLADAKTHPERREKTFEDMFEVAQMVRGSNVAQTMAMTVARLSTGNDAAGRAIRDLQDTRHEWDKARETLTLAQADPRTLSVQIDELEKKWADLNGKIEDLERQVQASAPTYNQVLDRKVPARDVIGALRPNEALSRILVGKESSFVFFVDPDGITAYEIDLTERRASELVGKMRQAVEATDQLRTFPVGDSYTLYEKLFGPVKDRLAKANHLITVPSGPLLSLPFGVLVAEPPGHFTRTYYSEIEWLALHKALTLAPSVQSFVNLRSAVRPSKASLPFIGFGDYMPHPADADAVLKSFKMPESCRDDAVSFANATSERLPNSATELRRVSAALGAPENCLMMGSSFCEATLQKTILENYRIVYFATHGLLPSKLKCFREPGLVLSSSQKGEADDGLLTTSKIVNLKLDADLVVLSACDTGGAAGQTGGESLSGLARAFFYAGARSLLVTLWEFLDKPTAELLITCFNSLATKDVSLAEAVRGGQAALIENPKTSHPMIWGAFTLVGDGGQHLGGARLTSN